MATRHARIEDFYKKEERKKTPTAFRSFSAKKEDTHGFSQLFHAMDMFKIIY